MSASIYEYADHCGPQLVPSSAWNSNLRAILSASEWKALRERVFAKHGKQCGYCRARPRSLDCHEIWSYSIEAGSSSGKQSLVKIQPLCRSCHMVCHIGFWSMQGKYDQVLAHMMRVRKLSKTAAALEVEQAFSTFDALSKFEWILDIGAVSLYIDEARKVST